MNVVDGTLRMAVHSSNLVDCCARAKVPSPIEVTLFSDRKLPRQRLPVSEPLTEGKVLEYIIAVANSFGSCLSSLAVE